jgi:hypothetical protein
VREILKVFIHSPPPLERERLISIVELTIPKVITLSIQKGDCEKYLLSYKFIPFRKSPLTPLCQRGEISPFCEACPSVDLRGKEKFNFRCLYDYAPANKWLAIWTNPGKENG